MGDPKKTQVRVTERVENLLWGHDYVDTCDQCGVAMHLDDIVYPPDHEESGVVLCGDACLSSYQAGVRGQGLADPDLDEVIYGVAVRDLVESYERMRQEFIEDTPEEAAQWPTWAELTEAQKDTIIRATGHNLAHTAENWSENLPFIVPDALARAVARPNKDEEVT